VVEHVDPKIKKNEEYLHVYQLALREVGEWPTFREKWKSFHENYLEILLTMVLMMSTDFQNITSWNRLKDNQTVWEMSSLSSGFQARKRITCWFPVSPTLQSWRWKHRLSFTGLHRVATPKITQLFIEYHILYGLPICYRKSLQVNSPYWYVLYQRTNAALEFITNG
jgi:hypothetical protein